MNILHILQQKFRDALESFVDDPEPFAAMVRPTQEARFGDYQANCAMSLAKELKKKPRDIAQEIVSKLDLGEELQEPEIAGPGFINLRLQGAWMAKQLQRMAADERLGVTPVEQPRTLVIDFSSPNVAKPMHVGHLRSTIIGDALTRLFRFLGNKVATDNHLGDWGTQFGMLLYGYKNFRDDENLAKDPVHEMVRLYLLVRDKIRPADEKNEKNDDGTPKYTPEKIAEAEKVAEICRQETAKLHAGDEENNELWKKFMPWCREELNRIYRRLDVEFDETLGESFYNPRLPGVVESLAKENIAERSQGAMAIFFGEDKPPALVQKTDGAFTYMTTDLATIAYRAETWNPDGIYYVVDARQAQHFQYLFETARRWKYDAIDFQHISFGSVLGKDRKPIKTREGGAVELSALLDEAVERAASVYDELRQESIERGEEVFEPAPEEHQQIVEAVGLGAVKYADLCQNRTTDYVFSWEKMLAMNGNTATYMQYAYVRNRGIFRKADTDVERFRTNPPLPILETEHERGLAVQLLRLEETLIEAASDFQPSNITSYLWDLSKCYSGFFQNCPVLKAETPELRESRLLLCDLTARVIQQCLQLLGIRTVERM